MHYGVMILSIKLKNILELKNETLGLGYYTNVYRNCSNHLRIIFIIWSLEHFGVK
jgi:hypothetical protein